MSEKITKVVGSCLLTLAWSASLQADHHMTMEPAAQVDLYTCNYVGNADRDDLDVVVEKYNKWADQHDNTYTAWLLTPSFVNADIDWDIGWMGAWANGNAMGATLDTWMEKGIQAEFDRVLSCDMHIAATSLNIKPPKNPTPSASAVVSFRSCSITEGVSFKHVLAGTQQMGEFMSSKGSTGGAWMFFPTMGAGKVKFDYFFVLGYENYKALGRDQEIIANGGGWQKRQELMDGKTSCDVPRIYSAELVRSAS